VLLGLTSLSVIIGALWCASSFRERGNDGKINSRLSTFDLIFGIIFAILTTFELFGFIAAWRQQESLMRVYSLLSVISVLVIVAVQVLSIVVDFTFKNDLIAECIKEVTSSNSRECFGYWCTNKPKNLNDGTNYCHHQWTKIILGDFVWFFIALFCSTLFSYMAFAYLHELRNIGRPVNPQRYAMQDYPTHYDGLDYQYPPPPGPPPPQSSNPYDSASKPPDYEHASEDYTYEPDTKKVIEDD